MATTGGPPEVRREADEWPGDIAPKERGATERVAMREPTRYKLQGGGDVIRELRRRPEGAALRRADDERTEGLGAPIMRRLKESRETVRRLMFESAEMYADPVSEALDWRLRVQTHPDRTWRPVEGVRGLFLRPETWDDMVAWHEQAREAWSGQGKPPKDMHIPKEAYHPKALALGPWRVDGPFREKPVPVALHVEDPPASNLSRSYWAGRKKVDPDRAIIAETVWGLEDGCGNWDTHLAFHHGSYGAFGTEGSDLIVKDVEKGWIKELSEIPFVPVRYVPRGLIDEITKRRPITDHTHPFGSPFSTNAGIDVADLPEFKLGSGVKYARMVGIFHSAGAPIRVWKRDAKSAFRQIPICPGDLWKCALSWRSGAAVDERLCFGIKIGPNKFQRLMLVLIRDFMSRVGKFDAEHPTKDGRIIAWQSEREGLLGEDHARMEGVTQYIDDTLVVSFDDWLEECGRTRGQEHIRIFEEVMAEAGVELAGGDKAVDSLEELIALGVHIDLETETVGYPKEKARRLTLRMEGALVEARAGKTVGRAELESLVGKLVWAAHVAPDLNPLMASSYAALRGGGPRKGRSRGRVQVGKRWINDQVEILGRLPNLPRVPLVSTSTFPAMEEAGSAVIFQDASTGYGIGGFVWAEGSLVWMAERWPPHIYPMFQGVDRRIPITAGELFAELVMVYHLARRGGKVGFVTDFCDNEAAKAAANKGSSTSLSMVDMAARLAEEVTRAEMVIRTLRVSSKENSVSDGLSRGEGHHAVDLAEAAGVPVGRVERVGVPGELWDMLERVGRGFDV